jgi:ATP-dependent helicase/DNAse subunit B
VYYGCPLFWLYARIFGAGEFSLEAALLDDTSLGLLYHKILEELFTRIKDEDKTFNSRRLNSYKRWPLEITMDAIKEHPAFKGPLAVPLVSPQAAGMAKKIAGLLDLEAKFFDGYAVAELELPVIFRTGEIIIKGVIDRVSVSPDGDPVIVDYKTSYLPDQTDIDDLEEIPLSEFQMPLYIKLYEESSGAKAKVQGAFFYSINGQKIKTVMGDKTGGRTAALSREEYEPFLKAAEKQIDEFAQKVKALDFTPRELRIGECLGCVYKTACRSSYFLNRESHVKGEEY